MNAKIAKKEAELLEAKQKREKIIEEIREELGYNVDPRDERFQAILEQKEKEDKKKKKELKKKMRAEKLLAYIQQTDIESKEEEKEKNSSDEIVPSNEEGVDKKDYKETK